MDENQYSEILNFKNQFKKQNVEKSDNNISLKNQKSFMKSVASYFYTFIVFIISLLLLYLIFDKWLMPSLVHNRELVRVPDVIGKSEDEAKKLIIASDLVYQVTNSQFSEVFPENHIVNQVPKKKTEVKEGRPVFLTVSKGKEEVTAPYLLGKSLRAARIELISRGLIPGKIEYEYSNDFPKDTIMEQSIKSGKLIPYDTKIDLTVSLGSENQVAVPVLIGRRIEDVEQVLAEFNLKLGNVTYRRSETFMPSSIIETFPSQNSLVQEGSTINIVVSK